jgi:hypothetical protein
MRVRTYTRWAIGVAGLVAAAVIAPSAQAQDFFSNFFGGFGRQRPPVQMPYQDNFQRPEPNYQRAEPRPRASVSVGGQSWCVRTCDGRYFPITGDDSQTRQKSCDSLCPAAKTEVVYGSDIDSAATDKGKPYSKLPNAFRYRNELVSDCTCNGKSPGGLARIEPENDPTLRKGDIVAGQNGLVVATKTSDRRGVTAEFSPASERIKARYRAPPVVARE